MAIRRTSGPGHVQRYAQSAARPHGLSPREAARSSSSLPTSPAESRETGQQGRARQGASEGALTARLLAPNSGREDDPGVLLSGGVGGATCAGCHGRGNGESAREWRPRTPLRRCTTAFLPRLPSAPLDRPLAQDWEKGRGMRAPSPPATVHGFTRPAPSCPVAAGRERTYHKQTRRR